MSKGADHFYGRTRRSFLNPQSINQHLICSICLDVFEEPSRLMCGHTFCYTCIQHWNKANRKQVCAQCKSQVGKRKVQKDLLASKMVDQLPVKCIHSGCNWVGINSLLKKHQRKCQYRQKKNQSQIQKAKNHIVSIDDDQQQQIIEVKQKKSNKQQVIWTLAYVPAAIPIQRTIRTQEQLE